MAFRFVIVDQATVCIQISVCEQEHCELHKFAYFVLVMKNLKEGSVWYQLKEYISPSLFFCFKSLLYIQKQSERCVSVKIQAHSPRFPLASFQRYNLRR